MLTCASMSRTDAREVTVPESMAGERLDRAIAALAPDISRGEARRLIAAGVVFIDDKRSGIQSRQVRGGERIHWESPLAPIGEGQARRAVDEPRIVVERAQLWIIDKPAGMPVEATRLGKHGTLHEWLVARAGAAFVTHRLDTPTSGLIVVARDRKTQAGLNALFAAHAVTRRYLAVVEPPPAPLGAELRFDGPLDGKTAVTHAKVVARSDAAAALVVQLETGRTRQIRRHLAGAGSPVSGETLSGARTAQRLLLHAFELGVPWPLAAPVAGRAITALAPPPADFLAPAAALGLAPDALEAATRSPAGEAAPTEPAS
jgi:23S rRNA pseudouridine1911/1915/1917 synthase